MQRNLAAAQASSSTEELPSRWLIGEFLSLRKSVGTVKGRARIVLESIEKELGDFIKFLENVMTHIESVSEKSSEEDTDLKDFAAYLKGSISKLKNFMEEANKNSLSIANLLHKANEFITTIPDLLEAIQRMDLGRYAGGMPSNFKDMHELIAKKMSSVIEQSLPHFFQTLVDHAEVALSDDEEVLAKFSRLEPFILTIDLTLAGTVVEELSKLVVFLDQLEIEYSLKEGSLLENISFKIPYKKQDSGLMTLKTLCERISHGYEERMDHEGYSKEGRVETFPYAAAKLKNRKAQLENLKQEDSKENSQLKVRQAKWRERTKNDNNGMIQKQLDAYSAKPKNTRNRANRMQALVILQGVIQSDGDFKAALLNLSKDSGMRKILAKKSSKVVTLVDNIKENKDALERQLQHSGKKYSLLMKRLEDKITVSMQQNESLIEETVHKQHATDSGMNQIMQALIKQANQLFEIIDITLMSHSTSVSHRSSESLLDTLTKYMQKVEKELSEALDEQVFSVYFKPRKDMVETAGAKEAGSSSAPEKQESVQEKKEVCEPTPWIADLGAIFQAAQEILVRLRKLQEEFAKIKLQRQRELQETPAGNVLQFIEMVNQTTEEVKHLVQSVKRLSFNPIISGGVSPAGIELGSKIDELKFIAGQVKQIPVVGYISTEGQTLASGMMSDQRIDYVIEKLIAFYQYASEKFNLDHTAQEILHRTLIAFHRLKSELDQELNEEKTSKVKLFKFVFKHMGELLTILLPHISNMKEALTTAVKEEALEMLQRANLLLRDFYVFADTLETEFFLKEGYITRKLNIGDISLHALLNDMHQAIEQAGYEFKSEERFPYSVTLQEDRVKRLEKK